MQNPQQGATAAGALVFHQAPAWLENQVLTHVYPEDKSKALDMLIRICELDQKISEQVRQAKLAGASSRPPLTVPLPGQAQVAPPSNPATPPVNQVF